MTEEAKEKKNLELEKQIQALQKENKKLRTWTDELIKSQEKVLQDAIQGAKGVIATNEETMKKGREMAELSTAIENVAVGVAKLAPETTLNIEKIATAAKNVGDVATKVAANAQEAVNASTKMMDMGKQAASVSDQMSMGMKQVSTASEQVSNGAQKLAELSQNAAQSTESLKKVMDEAGLIARETSTVTCEALAKSKEVNVKGQRAGIGKEDLVDILFGRLDIVPGGGLPYASLPLQPALKT